jgi:alanine racemase
MRSAPDACEPCLTVDLDALAANYHAIAARVPSAETAPVVKADAYGTGASPVARRLWAEGARSFFVARASEGAALREALGPIRPAVIYVLDGCPQGAADRLKMHDLTPVLNGLDQVEHWSAAAPRGGRLSCALHIDTGLNRLGLRPEETAALADAPGRLNRLNVDLVLSHLACGGIPDHPMNRAQRDRFAAAAVRFPEARRSLASSGAAFQAEDYSFDMIRAGVSLYGGGPFDVPDSRILPVATLDAPIVQVRNLRPGETVGYGATYTVDRPLRLAVIALGYADGVLRTLSPEGYGWLAGRHCPLLGRISMDLIAMDVTEVVDAAPGQRVELFGPNLDIDTVARQAGTVSYELLSRISARVRRVYLGETPE